MGNLRAPPVDLAGDNPELFAAKPTKPTMTGSHEPLPESLYPGLASRRGFGATDGFSSRM
ncbi:hypothetical protein EV132_101183 [Rhizobium sullae]|uniref:Uncharacterized protein n=1 Tax=Rhizobium sullae TaxID=50338 RepID=A0A4R3QGF9_RHISU|nr:hypothetical protein EV132_101183 [Rhizobium sullae]